MNVERLRNLVKALREVKEPDKFTMIRIMHPCGTPACAFGQYAFRTDLQDEFYLKGNLGPLDWESSGVMLKKDGGNVSWDSQIVEIHFDIDAMDLDELFNADGCGDAQTATEAADYVEQFIRFKAMDEMVKISEEMGGYDGSR